MDSMDQLYSIYKASNGVEIDSRKIAENQLFFAFRGEHTDGHRYVEQVLKVPGCYAVIDDPEYALSSRCILVNDTLEALQKLARRHRDSFSVPVLALTGSNGKTTTKELMMAVLSIDYRIHATAGNYNNHIGVPLTLLAAPEDAEILIIEMGANRLHDIEELCAIADPDMGLITNIGTAHIGTFGSQENILTGKTELYRHIAAKGGLLFVNKYDEMLLSRLPENTPLVLYPEEEFKVENRDMYLLIQDLATSKSYQTRLTGLYNAHNIQAALSVGRHFDVDRARSLEAVAAYEPRMNRSQILDKGRTRLIMDAYNANPTSMRASIQSMIDQSDNRKKILVLGDMLELGSDELDYHRGMLEFVGAHTWDKIILVGPLFGKVLKDKSYTHFNHIDELLNHFKGKIQEFEESIVLLKASRSIRLEKFLELFEE